MIRAFGESVTHLVSWRMVTESKWLTEVKNYAPKMWTLK